MVSHLWLMTTTYCHFNAQMMVGARHFLKSIYLLKTIYVSQTRSSTYTKYGELAWTSFNCILRRFTYDWIGFGYLNNPAREKKIHPTQKPVALYQWLLKNYAKEGDKILDTHLGSGSSRIAADIMKMDFVGMEIDNEYYEKGNKRYEQYKSQLRIEGW